MNRLADRNEYLPVVVIMHEFGHRANTLSGRTASSSRREENQADCEAGAQTRFARNAGRLPSADVARAASLFFSLGDVPFINGERRGTGAHGSPPERLASFMAGYRGSDDHRLDPCGQIADGASPTQLSINPGG